MRWESYALSGSVNDQQRGAPKTLNDRELSRHETSLAALVFRPDGTLEHATAAACEWLDPGRHAALSAAVAATEGALCIPQASVTIESADAHLVAMGGNHGRRVLVTLRSHHAAAPEHALKALSPRQSAVASYASAGATAKEIADHLGISTHTVRQHLKAIYRALGVSTRVELLRRIGERPEP